jgi:hypothetical protein
MWCNCSIYLSLELDHSVHGTKQAFHVLAVGSSVYFFPISWWNQGGEHPYADFDLTGDIISRTLKTVVSKHKYSDTYPKKPVICHAFQAIVFQ